MQHGSHQATATIAVDAMGGDHGPSVCVTAALSLLEDYPNLELVLVGDQAVVEPMLASAGGRSGRVSIHHAEQIVGMDEHPRDAVRKKKRSSMRLSIDLVRDGRAGACVSAGNTGALMATARFVLKTLPGIDRPAIISAVPAANGHTHMLDLGANAHCTAAQLMQFAVMGSVVAADVHGLDNPRIGLLNIGAEDIKGHEVVQEASRLLSDSRLNYIGFVEGNDIFHGDVDVVVTDGFSGNVAIKTMEGLAKMIGELTRGEFNRNVLTRLQGLAAMPVLKSMRANLDPRRYNGATLVGLNGIVLKSHGSADRFAFRNALETAVLEIDKGVPSQIGKLLAEQEV